MRTLTVMLLWAVSATAAAAGEETAIGSASIVGAGTLISHAKGAFVALAPGGFVHQGDRLRTQEGSLKVTFNDNSTISLAPRSEIELNEFLYKPQAARRSLFKLWGGKLKASISKFLASDNDVRIATPTAVAGVRGTEFLVGVTQNESALKPEESTTTHIVVFDGKVNVKSAFEQVAGDVDLTAGQSSLVAFNQAPGTAVELSPAALRGLQRAASAKNKGALRASVSDTQLTGASSGIEGGVRRSAFQGASLGPPPIHQQPTDAQHGSTLTIRVNIPGQQ